MICLLLVSLNRFVERNYDSWNQMMFAIQQEDEEDEDKRQT
jgi:hypothetical protein